MADRAGVGERVVRQLTRQTRLGRAYRGRILSLERNCYGGLLVEVHQLPRIARGDIVLPELVLRRLERHAIAFSRHAARLRAADRHLKRGVLLYGPPGTGKTLSAMYVVASMPERTVLQLTGAGMGSIDAACRMARLLEPSTVLLEDVDLIGTEREEQSGGANALLFELLNQMDGLGPDADVLFVLTTNRPDVLEPALAARPGRVDQAIEIPLPDADCRRRLFELYSRGLDVRIADWGRAVDATAGVSASFIRELLRKAALLAAEASERAALIVREHHLDEATHELLVAGGPLTQRLLGGLSSPSPRSS